MFFLASFWSSGKTPVVLIGMQVLHNISINYNSDKLCIEQGVPLSTCETENKVSTMRRKQTKYNQSTKESAILYAIAIPISKLHRWMGMVPTFLEILF